MSVSVWDVSLAVSLCGRVFAIACWRRQGQSPEKRQIFHGSSAVYISMRAVNQLWWCLTEIKGPPHWVTRSKVSLFCTRSLMIRGCFGWFEDKEAEKISLNRAKWFFFFFLNEWPYQPRTVWSVFCSIFNFLLISLIRRARICIKADRQPVCKITV